MFTSTEMPTSHQGICAWARDINGTRLAPAPVEPISDDEVDALQSREDWRGNLLGVVL